MNLGGEGLGRRRPVPAEAAARAALSQDHPPQAGPAVLPVPPQPPPWPSPPVHAPQPPAPPGRQRPSQHPPPPSPGEALGGEDPHLLPPIPRRSHRQGSPVGRGEHPGQAGGDEVRPLRALPCHEASRPTRFTPARACICVWVCVCAAAEGRPDGIDGPTSVHRRDGACAVPQERADDVAAFHRAHHVGGSAVEQPAGAVLGGRGRRPIALALAAAATAAAAAGANQPAAAEGEAGPVPPPGQAGRP